MFSKRVFVQLNISSLARADERNPKHVEIKTFRGRSDRHTYCAEAVLTAMPLRQTLGTGCDVTTILLTFHKTSLQKQKFSAG